MQQAPDNLILLLIIGTVGMLVLALSVIILQIRSQNRTLRQRQETQATELAHQKALLAAIVSSQENERRRIGQDLHDDIGAALSGLRFSLDMYKPTISEEERYAQFNRHCKTVVDDIMHELRHIAHHLSPSLLTLHGLDAALTKQLSFINHDDNIEARLINLAPNVINGLSLETSTALYRVLEELLNNTLKHAKANQINIGFEEKDQYLLVTYQDNGIGFTPGNTGGMGLQNIESRLSLIGATYQLNTSLGNGLNFQLKYPLTSKTNS